MGYQQFWHTSKSKVKNPLETVEWENYVCFANLKFQNDLQHWNVQLIHPDIVDKYLSVLDLLFSYFKCSNYSITNQVAVNFYKNKTKHYKTVSESLAGGHIVFLTTWEDISFFNNYKLRLFFLTILRIGQESPWVLYHWKPEEGFEGLCKWSAVCNNDHKLRKVIDAPFTDNNSGHLLAWHNDVKRFPSIETCIFHLLNKDDSIHNCTHNLLKGSRYND